MKRKQEDGQDLAAPPPLWGALCAFLHPREPFLMPSSISRVLTLSSMLARIPLFSPRSPEDVYSLFKPPWPTSSRPRAFFCLSLSKPLCYRHDACQGLRCSPQYAFRSVSPPLDPFCYNRTSPKISVPKKEHCFSSLCHLGCLSRPSLCSTTF